MDRVKLGAQKLPTTLQSVFMALVREAVRSEAECISPTAACWVRGVSDVRRVSGDVSVIVSSLEQWILEVMLSDCREPVTLMLVHSSVTTSQTNLHQSPNSVIHSQTVRELDSDHEVVLFRLIEPDWIHQQK